jgi:hypothetical protein
LPDIQADNNDVLITFIMITCGTVLFSKFMATLNVIFEDKNKKLTVNWKMMRLEEQVTAFVIDYNEQSTSRFLSGKDIKEYN